MKKDNRRLIFFKSKPILFIISFVIGGFVVPIVFLYFVNKFSGTFIGTLSAHIYHILFVPSITITNVIINFPNFQLFDFTFWNVPSTSLTTALFIFSIQVLITFIVISQKYRKKYLFLLLISYLFLTFIRFYKEFNHLLYASEGIKLGKGWTLTFIDMFLPLFISITLIYYISIKLNYKSLFIIILRYIFLFFEVVITLFVGFILIRVELDTGATKYDLFFHRIYILTLGFFLFLIIQLVRDFLKKKLKGFG